MELRHLRYFAAVAAEGSLSRAAERLHMTQPSLSRQIRHLEQSIGAPLFERTPAGMSLTPAGAALHRHVLLLLRLVDAVPDMAHSAVAQTREVVHLGVPPGVDEDWLLRVLGELEASAPHAAVTLTEASSTEQLRMIREGRLDLGMVRERPDSGHAERLSTAPFGVAVRPGHPLSDQSMCRMRDLNGLRVMAHSRQQVPVVDDRLVLAAHDAGALPLWQFVQFSEHARAAAEAVKADAVLLIERSARQLLPDWPWRRLTEPELSLVTWLIWPRETRAVVNTVASLIASKNDETTPPSEVKQTEVNSSAAQGSGG